MGFAGGHLCLGYHSMSHLAGQQEGAQCLDEALCGEMVWFAEAGSPQVEINV